VKPKIESNMVSTQICIKSCSTNKGDEWHWLYIRQFMIIWYICFGLVG
jgi:hypothetical protein